MTNWTQSPTPILALAPMADMTDSAYCQIARQASGLDFVIFREMVNSDAIVHGNEKTLAMCRFDPTERPIIQQLFGGNPQVMAEATRIVDDKYDPDGFDINMGCPARKIVGNFNGAALIRDPRKAASIVRAMKTATTKPVSVKTRLGWSDKNEILEFAKHLEGAGADLLTIHGRTKDQGYSGQADWDTVGRVKETLKIPVILNGDVVDGESAAQALKTTNCDGLMIGRAALGNPWIFTKISHFLSDQTFTEPTLDQRLDLVLQHAQNHAVGRPESTPLISLRAHLVHYLKAQPRAKEWREATVTVSTIADLKQVVKQFRP